MPIRKRISDPYSQSYKDFQKRRKYGAPPKAPRKPKIEERTPFIEALQRIPLGKTLSVAEASRISNYFITKVYQLWGVELAVYAANTMQDKDKNVLCVGAFIRQRTRNRQGVMPMITLRGEKRSWYREVLDWIHENNYDI